MKQRIITALIALPLLILCILYSSQGLFAALIFIASALALHEFYRMALPETRRLEASLSVAVGVLCCVGLVYTFNTPFHLLSMVLPCLFLTLVYLFRFQDMQSVSRDLAVSLLGLMYIPLLLSHAALMRALPAGRDWIFLVLLVVMASDTLAYFVGRKFGRHRLYEAVSPKKTIEGSLGGLVGGVVGAMICKFWFFAELSGVDVLFVGIGVGAFSQLGDLVESLLKRSFGVKDSGALIPGHGGILDRLDSLLFAFPVTYYYAVWVIA
ncbi:MAG: phosphatidate cytidylyltransferase [Desulfuromonadales bacterium]|nr:phosphatidate cytidylyltransferase [Desulfuromonadales bacterium]